MAGGLQGKEGIQRQREGGREQVMETNGQPRVKLASGINAINQMAKMGKMDKIASMTGYYERINEERHFFRSSDAHFGPLFPPPVPPHHLSFFPSLCCILLFSSCLEPKFASTRIDK